jgi:hypothetical protein
MASSLYPHLRSMRILLASKSENFLLNRGVLLVLVPLYDSPTERTSPVCEYPGLLLSLDCPELTKSRSDRNRGWVSMPTPAYLQIGLEVLFEIFRHCRVGMHCLSLPLPLSPHPLTSVVAAIPLPAGLVGLVVRWIVRLSRLSVVGVVVRSR